MMDDAARQSIYQTRQAIAERQNAEVARARDLLGPAQAYAAWYLVDTTGAEETRVVPCCRRKGVLGWVPSAEEAFGEELLFAKREDGFDFNGKIVHFHRYQLRIGVLEEYHPLPPEETARRNATRKANQEKKAIERDKASMPLFANQIE